ncbi:MAG TPA: hypothetical protein VIX89_10805 [Bryobacteraceae bacterium]
MHRFPPEQIVLLILQASILLGLVFRLWATELFRKYPCFFGYLLVVSVQTVIGPFFSFDSAGYRYWWLVTQALLTFFCALIVLEMYALVLRDLTGLASRSRRYLKISMGVAIFGSLLLLLLEKTPHDIFNGYVMIDRVLVTSLLIFVLLLTAFLVYYPIPINRNLVVYSIGYVIYFLPKAGGLLVVNISHAWYRQVGIVTVTASTVSVLLWLVGLSRRGEKKTWVIGHPWNPEDHEKVLKQLKAINEKLLRKGKE